MILLPPLTWEDAAIVAVRGRYAIDENGFVYQLLSGPFPMWVALVPDDHWDMVGYQDRIILTGDDGATLDELVEDLAGHRGDLEPDDRVENPDAAPRVFFLAPDATACVDPKVIAGGTVRAHNHDPGASLVMSPT